MSTILFTDPAHDEATKVLSGWIKSVSDYISGLEAEDHKVVGLNGDAVTKQNFIGKCVECSPRLIMINGHGNQSTLCGHNDEPIVEEDNENVHFQQSIVHALACAAAKSLGHRLVTGSVETFIGYSENFHFYHDVKEGQDPTKDPLSALFLEPAYDVPKSLANGLNAQEAFDKSQAMSQQNLLMAFQSNIDQPILASMFHNIKSHTLIGNPSSSI